MSLAQQELADLLCALGLGFDPKLEELDEIQVRDTAVDVGKIQGALPQIQAATAAYGSALEASFRFEYPPAEPDDDPETKRRAEQPEWLHLDSSLTGDSIKEFLKKNARGAPVVLALILRKRDLSGAFLAGNGLHVPAGIRPALVLDPQALENLFSQELQDIETWWDPRQPAKLVILAPAWGHILNGRYLAIVGGEPVAGWRLALSAPPASEFPIPGDLAPDAFLEVRRNDLRWEETWVKHLTPLHLAVAGNAPAQDSVAQALRVHVVNVCLLYTADRSDRKDRRGGGWQAVYSGAGERVIIAPATLAEMGDDAAVLGTEALTRMVWWAYEARFRSDRLDYLQSAVARLLRPFVPDGQAEAVRSCRSLLLRAGDLGERLDRDWKMFIDGRLDKFGVQMRALEDDVAKTVDAFSSQIGAMIKSLSDAMLAAVGVLLGAYIAALIKKELRPEILRFSVATYILYLLIFPLGYSLRERWGSYKALLLQFQNRCRRFEGILSKAQVQAIVEDQIDRSERRFRVWFNVVFSTYLLVAGVLWSLVPSPIDSVAYHEDARVLKLEGPLAPNKELRSARPIGEGRLEGAEDVAVDAAGRLYTGTAGGRILSLDPANEADLRVYAETGGRPLGLRFGAAGKTLFVADADKGLLAIDPAGGVKVLATKAGGIPFAFTNDLDVAPDGTIYFSDSSRFGVNDYLYDLLEARPRGRLLAYTPPPAQPPGTEKKEEEEGKVRILLDGLSFANGVALARGASFVLVAETYRYRIRRYWLTGGKAGTSEIFIDGLPGFPDNLSRDPETGRFWVALFTVRNPAMNFLHRHPFFKNQLAKLPLFFWPRPKPYGLVIELDENGKVLRSLQDPTGESVHGITSAEPHGGKLYLGSLDDPLSVWSRSSPRQAGRQAGRGGPGR